MSIGLIPPPTVNYGDVFLGRYSASASASVDIINRNAVGCPGYGGAIFQSDFDVYKIVISGLVPATTSTNLLFRMSSNNGVAWDSGASDYAYTGFVQGVGGAGSFGSGGATFGALNKLNNMVNTSTKPVSSTHYIRNPLSTAIHKTVGGNIDYWDTAPNLVTGIFSGSRLSTTAMNAIQYLMNDSGGTIRNITSGDIDVYGLYKG